MKERLGGRCARNAGRADKVEVRYGFIANREAGDGSPNLQGNFRRRLRNRGVADVADLAMIFVVRVRVPVADRMRSKKSQRQNSGDGQQAIGDSFRHARLDVQVKLILPLSHATSNYGIPNRSTPDKP